MPSDSHANNALPGSPIAGLLDRMVPIQGGTFQMGCKAQSDGEPDEQPIHEVTLDAFAMCSVPVTQAMYEAVMGENPSHFKGPDLPVEQVTWNDAVAFCEALSNATGQAFALPTEAQWEYACRAGSTTKYCFNEDEERLDEYAWYEENSGRRPHPVGQKKPNKWGLYDMHGNVWEWCADWHGDYSAGAQTNPTGPPSGEARVLRGGSFLHPRQGCQSGARTLDAPDSVPLTCTGFRVVRIPSRR